MFDEIVGRRIEGARKATGWTAKELARATQMSPSAIWSYESGRTTCPARALQRIAKALDVSVTALMPKSTQCGFPVKTSCAATEVL